MKKLIIKAVLFILEWAMYTAFGLIVVVSFLAVICGDGNKELFDLIAE